MTLPSSLREHLLGIAPLWVRLRERLERNGLAIAGYVVVPLDAAAADRLSGVLGRLVVAGRVRVSLVELDAALRGSSAGRGLAAVVAELTGGPLRDRVAERADRLADARDLWAAVDDELVAAGLASDSWAGEWVQWLRSSGVLARRGVDGAVTVRVAVKVLSELLNVPGPRSLPELAVAATGTAHGLDDGRPVSLLVLRAAALFLGVPAPGSAYDRRVLWHRLGVSTDAVSGTVLCWGLRPPGADRWSAMMRDRSDLGLVTHLISLELAAHDVPLAADGEVVFACENPQVLQAAAVARVARPLICTSGNPSAAGLTLLQRVSVRYHGDFDWPGVAIARRILAAGATPWRFGAADYLAAVAAVPVGVRLPLEGVAQPTPWDEELGVQMAATDVAVHEEALLPVLLEDLM
ncbi:TIGR02679 family protein [Nakamurella sp. YIM 132087]|uniref:TIGR02679 family protein n=1 Tax=Nakamurella alba TaxID=2665158 RepID=A0A7K1FQT4_9ACTN|nr:TIGR02679 family protein [Nakamurella alba]MTD15144.1 TIGR02679 family protein [Nakamurella alba]